MCAWLTPCVSSAPRKACLEEESKEMCLKFEIERYQRVLSAYKMLNRSQKAIDQLHLKYSATVETYVFAFFFLCVYMGEHVFIVGAHACFGSLVRVYRVCYDAIAKHLPRSKGRVPTVAELKQKSMQDVFVVVMVLTMS